MKNSKTLPQSSQLVRCMHKFHKRLCSQPAALSNSLAHSLSQRPGLSRTLKLSPSPQLDLDASRGRARASSLSLSPCASHEGLLYPHSQGLELVARLAAASPSPLLNACPSESKTAVLKRGLCAPGKYPSTKSSALQLSSRNLGRCRAITVQLCMSHRVPNRSRVSASPSAWP